MLAADWERLARDPRPEAHVAVVYKHSDHLARAVADWLEPGLARGGVVLLATVSHLELVRRELRRRGLDVDGVERAGRFVALDAHWAMAQFVLERGPDAATFRRILDEVIARVRASAPGQPVRAWGEVVALLRVAGRGQDAHQLEELWNAAIAEHGIDLLCSYTAEPLDALGKPSTLAQDVAATHTHVFPQDGL